MTTARRHTGIVTPDALDFFTRTGAERTARVADPRSRLARLPAEQRFVPSFMALFVSPPDRRVAGETCTVSALLKLRVTAVLDHDPPAVMNVLSLT